MIAVVNVVKALLARWRVALFALLSAAAVYAGYAYRDARADREIAELREKYTAAALQQAVAALSTSKKQKRVTEDADANYQARLAELRADYERRLREQASGAGNVRPVPAAPGEPDATAEELAACRAELAEIEYRAAADALQLRELQRWINEQLRLTESQ